MRDGHAVVLGAGMAGLFAARVLSETFENVTIVDRDPLPATAVPRRGVPQARHVHGLQARGVQILEELFPGLTDEMCAAGATRIGDLSGLHFSIAGHLLCQQPAGIAPVLMSTRPFLELSVRSRVERIEGVSFRANRTVAELLHNGSAVRGVYLTAPDGSHPESLEADLVVDATGRGSRLPTWLKELGYEAPAEDRIAVRVKYASYAIRFPSVLEPRRFAIDGRTPTRAIGPALFGCENDTWIFTVMGAQQAFPQLPTRQWMADVSVGLLPEWAKNVVRNGEPLGPVVTQQHPTSLRRRYDRLASFPEGLLVIGDSMCAFNPVYGQGMSVAAEQALVLRRALRDGVADVRRRYLPAAASVAANAWALSAGSDLAYPEVEGNPSRAMRLINRYVLRVLTVAEYDPEVARRFMAVSGLITPKSGVFHPRVVGAVLRSFVVRPRWTAGAAPAEASTPVLADV